MEASASSRVTRTDLSAGELCYHRSPMNSLLSTCGIWFCVVALCCAGSQASAQQVDPIERIVAIVDEDPILLTEIDQMIGLGLATREEGDTEADLRRRILDILIINRLRFHEINRFGFSEIPFELVDDEVAALQERLGTEVEFDERLERLGISLEELRQLIAQRLMTLIYVEERLGPRIFVDIEDIQEYFEEVLKPAMEETGQPLPALQDVREQIRGVIREGRLDEQMEIWTQELRAEADVVDYLDRDQRQLPSHEIEFPEPDS